MGGGAGSKVTLVFCFGTKLKFCSFDFDLDQAEQQFLMVGIIYSDNASLISSMKIKT